MPRSSRSHSSRRIQNKFFARIKKWSIGLVITGFVIWASLVSLSYARWGKIHSFQITQSHHIDAGIAQQQLQKILDSHWPIMGNRDRHWTLPNKKITESVKTLSDSIRTIDIDYHDHVLDIGLTFFEPNFITCFTDQYSCWFTSNDGYVFAPAPEFSEGVYPMLVIDQKTPNIFPHRLSDEDQKVFDTVFKQSPIGDPSRIALDMLDVRVYMQQINGISLGSDAYVVVSRDQIAEYETYINQRFEALRTKTDFFDRLESQSQTFEYLDIRFVDKMYIKFSD